MSLESTVMVGMGFICVQCFINAVTESGPIAHLWHITMIRVRVAARLSLAGQLTLVSAGDVREKVVLGWIRTASAQGYSIKHSIDIIVSVPADGAVGFLARVMVNKFIVCSALLIDAVALTRIAGR